MNSLSTECCDVFVLCIESDCAGLSLWLLLVISKRKVVREHLRLQGQKALRSRMPDEGTQDESFNLKMATDSDRRNRSFNEMTLSQSSQAEFATKFRRLRACARCHRLKMRCTFEDPSFESCTRCFKAGLRCSITEDPTSSQAKPRPRKRTKLQGNGPLAQLQRAINESNKVLNSIQRNETDNSDDICSENLLTLQFQLGETQRLILHAANALKEKGKGASSTVEEASSINSMKDGTVKSVPNLPWISYEANIMKELIKMEIISTNEARSRMKTFLTQLYPYWPCISFPKHYNYDWLLENEPLVLLTFITVTCLNEPDLHDTLLYYLEDNLSVRTFITGNISVGFIQIYLVLSLWCSPPKRWGSYKHQMSLLMALNLTLCLDLGNEVYKNGTNVLSDDSVERLTIRSYMAVYACCGSLGLSLPRFKVVNWTPVHERCCQLLLLGDVNQADKFLYYYSRLVALGEEIFQFLCPNGFPNASVKRNDIDVDDASGLFVKTSALRDIMVGYEKRMQKLATDSNMFVHSAKMRNLLSIIYYQLLMTMYDYVVCKVLVRRDVLTEIYLQTINRLIKASEKVIESFVELCDQTANFPTFFYYRPMHALVALIRARLLVKTQQLDLEIDVEREHDKVFSSLAKISRHSKVSCKMSVILTRISKWMKVSNEFNKNGATNSMVDLLNELGKEKAVENIKVNLKKETDNGDNQNLSNDSRIHFNSFIHYKGNTTIKPLNRDHIISSRMMHRNRTSDNNSRNDTNDSIFIPSPIGYSNSEKRFANGVVQSDMTAADNTLTSSLQNLQRVYHLNGSPMEPFESTIRNNDSRPMHEHSDQNKRFLPTQSSANVESEEAGLLPQQQQSFLNDLFSQIDTDIMNSEEEATHNGLSFTPMFDFLGTGVQTFAGDNMPIPDDWYKSL